MQTTIYILTYVFINTAGQICLKYASCESRFFIPCYIGGIFLTASSFLALIALYRIVDNPVIVFGLTGAGGFLLTQLALAVIFKPSLNWMHYLAALSVICGIVLYGVANSLSQNRSAGNEKHPGPAIPVQGKCLLYAFFAMIFLLAGPYSGAAELENVSLFRTKGAYRKGAAVCRKLLDGPVSGGKRLDLMFELAACYQFDTRNHAYPQAVAVYEKIIREFPGDPLCAKAYFNIGRCYDALSVEREKDITRAREAYKNCYEKFSGSLWAQQAYFWHANSYIYQLTPETAKVSAGMFEAFLKKYPDSMLAGVVHSQLSELYCAWLDNFRTAVKHSEAALAHGIRDANLRQLHLYRLGYLCQFKLNDKSKALKWYRQLMAESPAKSDPNYFVAAKRVKELSSGKDGGK